LFLFDADSAGQAAVERSFYLALEQGFVCYSSNTGDFKDVDDLIMNNPDEIKNIVEKRTDTFSYLLSRKVELIGAESLKSINYLSHYALSFIDKVSDETSRNFFITKAKQIVPKLILEQKQSAINETKTAIVKGETLDIEDMFIKSILETNSLKQLEELDDTFFKNAENIKLLTHVKSTDLNTTKELYDSTEGSNIRKRLEFILLSNAKSEDLEILRKRLTIRNIEGEIQNMRVRLAIAEEKEDTSQINELLKKIMDASNNLKKYKDEDIKL
jgi:DNA primase